ncbi:MAG: LytTR family DNA-binding domain-containing protein [Bacteroidota bacterium]
MIKVVAIDDEPIALKVIENFCNNIDFIALDKTFRDPKEGLKHLNKFPVDLLLLDIDMPFMNGIDLYKQLKQDTLVIFITSRTDYAVEGFNLMAVDYLVKPFTFDRFNQALKRANDFLNVSKQGTKDDDSQHLFIRADFSLIKITIDEILYIEALDDYLKIHIKDKKTLVARMTMKGILEKLPNDQFIRVHRSFIVAANRIQALRSKNILVENVEIPLGGNYAENVSKVFGK